MKITELFVSQRNLNRPEQIPALVKTILEGGRIPSVLLCETEDGVVQINDGHHRVAAYWLAGRTRLERHEYLLIQSDRERPRFGQVVGLFSRNFDAKVVSSLGLRQYNTPKV